MNTYIKMRRSSSGLPHRPFPENVPVPKLLGRDLTVVPSLYLLGKDKLDRSKGIAIND